MESFEIISEIADIETIAIGSAIREIARLRKHYGRGRWRKMKGIARIRLPNGAIRRLSSIGMKLTESAGRNLSGNATWHHNHDNISKIRFAVRRLHRKL